MMIRPLGDRVVLKQPEAETRTKSGLYLPETAEQEKPEQAMIVAIGDGEKVAKLHLKKKMTVLFSKYSGNDIELGGVTYKVVDHSDILAVIE